MDCQRELQHGQDLEIFSQKMFYDINSARINIITDVKEMHTFCHSVVTSIKYYYSCVYYR